MTLDLYKHVQNALAMCDPADRATVLDDVLQELAAQMGVGDWYIPPEVRKRIAHERLAQAIDGTFSQQLASIEATKSPDAWNAMIATIMEAVRGCRVETETNWLIQIPKTESSEVQE
jgi:hypothetical protein